jgi:hypothetical protein
MRGDKKKTKLEPKPILVKTILYQDLSVVTGGGCRVEPERA